MTARPHQPRSAFTLIETVVAVAISSVLLMTLGSTIVLASRAVPNGKEPVLTIAHSEYAAALLRTDIELALDFHTENETITIAVPDRDQDTIPEVIEYQVTPQRNLVRIHNRGPSEQILQGVKSLAVNETTADGRVIAVEVAIETDTELFPQRTMLIRLLNTPEAR